MYLNFVQKCILYILYNFDTNKICYLCKSLVCFSSDGEILRLNGMKQKFKIAFAKKDQFLRKIQEYGLDTCDGVISFMHILIRNPSHIPKNLPNWYFV